MRGDKRHLQCIDRRGYTGIDEVTEEVIKAKHLQLLVVSPEKAAQVLHDFPNSFLDLGQGPDLAAELSAANVVHVARPRRA